MVGLTDGGAPLEVQGYQSLLGRNELCSPVITSVIFMISVQIFGPSHPDKRIRDDLPNKIT